MRKVVLYSLMSLDGGVDNPDRYFPETGARSGPPVFDDDLVRLETEMVARQDAVLLGRRTYDEWAGYWPTSDEQPFADFINGVDKYVVTSSPLIRAWSRAQPVPGTDLAALVRGLAAQPGGDIGVHGSIRLAQALLAQGLVDELCLAVGRVLDPEGRRLFGDLAPGDRRELELVRAVPTPSGSLWLSYRLPTAR